ASGPKAPPRYSVDERDTGRVVAVEFEPDLPTYSFVEPEHPMAKLIGDLEAGFPDERVQIVSRTADDKIAVAKVSSDRDPGRYLPAALVKNRTEPFVDARPWVKPEKQARMSAFHIPASDGVAIHGFFTVPLGADKKTAPPLVVLVHGGPHGV